MEEDEDVILEGTSLYNHLKESGFTDFEVFSSQNEHNELVKDVNCIENYKVFDKKGSFHAVQKIISVFTEWINVDKWLLNSACLKIIESKLLEEEELLILESLSPTMRGLTSDDLLHFKQRLREQSNVALLPLDFQFPLATLKIWCFWASFLVCVKYLFGVSLFHLFLVVFSLLCSILIKRAFVSFMLRRTLNTLTEYLKMLKSVKSVFSKCLRFLLEVNILKRGLAQKSAKVQLFEHVYEKILREECASLFLLMSAHLQLKRSELMHFDLGEFENIRLLFSKKYEIEKVSCNKEEFVVQFLKEKRNVASLLSSAFLAEFLLCFEISREISIFNVLSSKRSNLIKEKIEMIEMMFTLSKKVWLKETPDHVQLSSSKRCENPKVDIKGAVDALSIKCRLVAYSSVHLQNIVESNEVTENEEFPFDRINSSCLELRNEILACSDCLADVLERTEKLNCLLFNRIGKQHVANVTSEDIDNETEDGKQSSVSIICNLHDHVIEDEIFEAVVDHSTRSFPLHEDETYFESIRKEKLSQLRQRERCNRVLQEIQPILKKRREIWQEREARAKDKAKLNNNDESPLFDASGSTDSGVSSPVNNFTFPLKENVSSLNCNSNNSAHDFSRNYENTREPSNPYSLLDPDGECDSEEERLLVYKRVKRELEEDEARRKNESDSDYEEDEFGWNFAKRKNVLLLPTSSMSLQEKKTECVQNNIQESQTEKILRETNSLLCGKETLKNDDLCDGKESLSANCKLSKNEETISSSNFSLPSNCDFKPHTITDDLNRFNHRELHEEDRAAIDWESCGLVGRRKFVDDDSESDVPFSGISSVFASEIFKRTIGQEEVFGGVGEGEIEDESCSRSSNE